MSSPTFALIHEYAGKCPVFHVDWYRLDAVRGPDRMLALECFESPGVTLVEWAGRGKGILPPHTILLELSHAGNSGRKIRVKGSAHARKLAEALA